MNCSSNPKQVGRLNWNPRPYVFFYRNSKKNSNKPKHLWKLGKLKLVHTNFDFSYGTTGMTEIIIYFY